MARKRRLWMPELYHHIYLRGNNRQNIFKDHTDMQQAFRLLTTIHQSYPLSICSFCIMTNHYHFLLKSETITISKIMNLFNKRYTDYYNQRYQHVGHVFQQRFNSSPIFFPKNLLYVSRYIHQNPIRTNAPMVARMEFYPYSSYQYYKFGSTPPFEFINLEDLPNSFPQKSQKYREYYCEYAEME
ncbi:transposase [Falsibacillus albus]|uniref:Transposase n=1 Tax=Falsibacillus albus TaxID=2478915 RepID=A0A3L7K3M0_9BACI|nr:transposase [Falsibacillus albus]RLQ96869.1 transposase [Falsibacillus albus]